MAKPAITYKSSVYSTTSAATYTASPTWTPGASSLLVAFCGLSYASSPADPTGVTGHGQTYTKITLPASSLSTTHQLSIWVANAGASPSSTACVSSASGTTTGGFIIEFEVTGWEKDEPAINAFGVIETDSGSSNSSNIAGGLVADVTSENVLMSFWCHLANEGTTPRVSWTETAGADGNYNNPATGAEAQFRTDAFELTASASWSTLVAYRGFRAVVRADSNTPTDSLKIADTVTAVITPLMAAPASENLKLLDDVLNTPRLDPGTLWMDRMFENVSVEDYVFGAARFVNSEATRTAGLMELPAVKMTDTLAYEFMVTRAVNDETLKLTDTVTAVLDPLQATKNLIGSFVNPPGEQPNGDPYMRISDVVTATLDPLQTSISESVKLVDLNQGVVQLIGVLHIQDTVTAQIVAAGGGDLSRAVDDEVLKLSDTVTASRDLTASLTEDLKLADTVIARTNPDHIVLGEVLLLADTVTAARGLTAELQEDLKLADTVTARTNPDAVVLGPEILLLADTVTAARDLTASLQEDLKLADTVIASRDLTASLSEDLRIADTVSARTNPDHIVLGPEVLLLADTLTASRDLTASLQEDLKVQDTLSAAILIEALLAESLRVADTLTAQITPLQQSASEELRIADSVLTTLDPEQASVSETLKLADTVSVTLDPEEASLSETLKLADTVSAFLAVDISASVSEILTVEDYIFGAARFVQSQNTRTAGLMELPAYKMTDGPVIASMGLIASVSETVLLADTVQAQLTVLQQTVAAESLKLADTVSTTLDPEEASRQEVLKLSDTVVATRDLEVAVADEGLRIQDTCTTSRDLTDTDSESCRVQDQIQASMDLVAVLGETLKCRDEDPVGVILAAGSVFQAEVLLLADTVQAELDTLLVLVSEVGALAEAVTTFRPPRVITSMHFTSEALSASAFSNETMSGNAFSEEALSEPMFSDEEMLP